jgi:hypothetical protein
LAHHRAVELRLQEVRMPIKQGFYSGDACLRTVTATVAAIRP